MTPTRLLAMALATGGLMAADAAGQQIPPLEDGPAIVTTTLDGGQVEMRDAQTGKAIMLAKGLPMWDDRGNGNSLAPEIEVQVQPSGYDAIYTFTNNGKTARNMGLLNAGLLTMGPELTYPDMKMICEPVSVNLEKDFNSRQTMYPQTTYSPVWVIQNQEYAVGVSLQYPIMEYKHDVRISMNSPVGRYADGEGGRGVRMEFRLSNLGNETEDNELYHPGKIEAGETRTYVVSVRVTKQPDEWMRTLVPYRNFFRSEYGGLEYVRDPRPINGRNFTAVELCSDDNPYGYGGSRPDLNGWSAVVSTLMERSNWGTLLFWTTSGSYRKNTDNNMPFQFATNWKATPGLATATDPKIGFPRIPASGQPIGFWWGRSVQVADKWDDKVLEPLDPKNPAHRAAAFAEMDLAVKAGATTIGLDTFSPKQTPVWELVGWLDDLKARYPGVRFCAEPVTCDLIHRKIPTYYRGHKDRTRVDTPEEIDGYYNPFYIADFLLPGHETWGAFRWARYRDWFGIITPDEDKQSRLQSIAELGFVPLSLEDFPLTESIVAAESWRYSIPSDLQDDGDGDGDGPGGPDGDEGDEGGNDGNPLDPFPTFDLFDAAFKAGDMRADLNGDGKLDFFDYTAWQNAHAPGDQNIQGRGDGPGMGAGGPSSPGPDRASRNRAAKGGRPNLQVSGAASGRAVVGSAGGRNTSRGRRSPISGNSDFTAEEIEAILARLKGLPAATTAGVPDSD